MPLPTGKISPYKLKEILFSLLELKDERVLVGPEVGIDASIVKLEDRVLALSSDPITGALKDPGWLSVHVNANDVATTGATPQWFLMNLFLPEGIKESEIREIFERAKTASEELGISLVGGHTEVTPGLKRVLISGAMIGEAPLDKWVSTDRAKPGDHIIFTKTAAIEGTFLLASNYEEKLSEKLRPGSLDKAKKFLKKISVVEDASTAINSGEVHAMHDPTEGGLVGGLHELADASKVGFSINSDSVTISEITREICDYFNIDPLKTIGSGSLLICCEPEDTKAIIKALEEKDIPASEIGEILEDEKTRLMDGKELDFPKQDELWRIFKT